jgi:small subunit ribosomal protein S3Ae
MAKKKKGKQWYTIIAPKMFGEVEIGRTISDDPDKIIGRKVSVSLMNLINDFRKYYMKFKFRVVDVDDSFARTEFDGSTVVRDYISRMVRRRSRRVDTVQDLKTKDGIMIRVKGMTIIPRQVKTSVKDTVRDSVREIVQNEVERSTLEAFIKRIISDDIKHRVIRESGRIYPIRNFEVRRTEILSPKKA